MAEREGFEPSVAVRATHDFQSCTFGHSVISPLVSQLKLNPSAVFDDAFGRPLMGLAERVGFEPTVTLQPQRFSRQSRSTTLAPLPNLSVVTPSSGRPRTHIAKLKSQITCSALAPVQRSAHSCSLGHEAASPLSFLAAGAQKTSAAPGRTPLPGPRPQQRSGD